MVGILNFLKRLFKSLVIGTALISRLDKSLYPVGWEKWDDACFFGMVRFDRFYGE
jgi:hypothetical protein